MNYLFPPKHSQKILWKFEHFPQRYKRKREWVFFSEHSVYGKNNHMYMSKTHKFLAVMPILVSQLATVTHSSIVVGHWAELVRPQCRADHVTTCSQ